MFSNQSATIEESSITYPINDGSLPFADYIKACRKIIEDRRVDLDDRDIPADEIISANCPYEFMPSQPIMSGNRIKYGVLMVHGLFDSPFTLRDIGQQLQQQGILARSILLPGHGTNPEDLMKISYHDWIQAVRYGVESLKNEVEQVYLIGFSTGAALSLYHAKHDSKIAGAILLSPAVKVRAPVDLAAYWHYIANYFGKDKHWVAKIPEIDYVKYKSIAFNGVRQVAKLTEVIRDIGTERAVKTPLYMILSREDETISSHHAIDFFTTMQNTDSKMLLYTSIEHSYPDNRIETRIATKPEDNIQHLSHPSLPFAPSNKHYGQGGDYINATDLSDKTYLYGAYNHMEIGIMNTLHKLRLAKYPRKVLTFNHDFDFMAKSISDFICR